MGLPTLRAAILLALVLAPALAAGGSISISIAPTAEVKDGVLTVRVRVSNGGDEAAESVAPVLQTGESTTRAEARPSLGPGESMTSALSLQVGTLAPGRWPYRLAVDYTDANQYPFQALHVGLFTVGSAPPGKVAVSEIKAQPLSGSGTIRVHVKNLAGAERQVALKVAVPDGLEVTRPVEPVSLAAWGEADVSVPIVNRTALVGSRYPIFVAAEYDGDGLHQAVVGQGIVEIQSAQSFVGTWRTPLWIAGGTLVVVWLGFLLWQALARRPSRA